MIIKKIGKYKLLKDYSVQSSFGIRHYSAGIEIEITQVDSKNRHVIGPELGNWVGWDMPVVEV